MKAYIEISDACDTIIRWINSGEYKRFVEATRGESKEDGFIAASYVIPSILLAKGNIIYTNENRGLV